MFSSDIHFSSVRVGDCLKAELSDRELEIYNSIGNTRRKAAFLAGRIAAKKALESLGRSGEVLRSESGEPIWLDGVVGSISHKNDQAIAVVASDSGFEFLGVDLEDLNREVQQRLAKRICSEPELSWVAPETENWQQRTLAIFSAKESIYKALFPRHQKYFGFSAVEFKSFPADSNLNGVFSGTLLISLQPYQSGMSVEVQCQRQDNNLVSICSKAV